MNSYKQTPDAIGEVLELFHRHDIKYLLFKCEHIFAGENKNLDILFETNSAYKEAARLLKLEGFVIRLSERIEKYKTLYFRFRNGVPCSIHLHREIAWHGMRALDKELVFRRQRKISQLISVPSREDSLLIHAGHVLFENFRITNKEQEVFALLRSPTIGRNYLKRQLRKNHWEQGFWEVLRTARTTQPLPPQKVLLLWLLKLSQEPSTFLYLLKKGARRLLRSVPLGRTGCLIACIGVNGSGKSTLSRKVLEAYTPCTEHLGKKQHYYYYGWEPRFFLTRIGSRFLQKKKKALFKNVVLGRKVRKFDFFQEILFLYLTFEYYYRYLVDIKPKLQKNILVVTDRYFYDIYGQYPYAVHSKILPLLIKYFPRPDATFCLTAPASELQQRPKTDRNAGRQIIELERTVLPKEYLQKQQRNYEALARIVPLQQLNTDESINKTCQKVVDRTWRRMT